MKKGKIFWGILAVAAVLGAAYGWFFVYNKPHRNFENAEADYQIEAIECYQMFVESQQASNHLFTGKILEISGIPKLVESSDSLCVLVFVFSEGMFGDEGIRCTMLAGHHQKTKQLSMNEAVKIKGFCSGYNGTDVVMEHCSIVKNK